MVQSVDVSYSRVQDSFLKRYDTTPHVVIQSPGRINIIGEHTDYNDGFVLPAAIDYYMYIAIAKNGSGAVNLYSVDFDESESEPIEDIKRTDNSWLNLINGVIYQLKDSIGGFDMAFGGNVPEGAGVSSSAALCCGVALGLSELFGLQLDKWALAKIAQKSEHDFSLVQCGIMDQFACLFGMTNHVLLLNCLTYEYQETEIDLSGFKFLLINSNVKHNLGDSDYNKRRDESRKALDYLKKKYKKVDSYQEVTFQMLEECKNELEEVYWKRAYHVVSENDRVLNLHASLKSHDHQSVGKRLTEGHESLKSQYEVTCEETDFLVNELNKFDIVYGARQVGGGFGGCVLILVKDVSLKETIDKLGQAYRKAYGLKLTRIPVKISKGCHRIV